jgi:hypothetical protein
LQYSSRIKQLCLVLAGFLVLSNPMNASEADESAAVKASTEWLSVVDKGQYGPSWDKSAQLVKTAVKRKDFELKLKASRGQFGQLVNRTIKAKHFMTAMPGAPDGKYVVIQYDSSFIKKKHAVETVTPMQEKDGQWKVSGYFIN